MSEGGIYSSIVKTIYVSTFEIYLREKVLKNKLSNESAVKTKLICRTFSAISFLVLYFVFHTYLDEKKSKLLCFVLLVISCISLL